MKRSLDFFFSHPVFTSTEYTEFLVARGTTNARTRDSLLVHHVKSGRIVRVRRGVYLTVPYGTEAKKHPVDSYLLASRLAPDAILAYHTALEFHGRNHQLFSHRYYLTATAARPLEFQGTLFKGLPFPKALTLNKARDFEVETADRQGQDVRVTSLERTLVDLLARPDLAGGWEEIWNSAGLVPYFKPGRMTEYALLLDSATVAARLGYFLEDHRKQFHVEEADLKPLRKRIPKKPIYMDLKTKGASSLVSGWNLIVPKLVLNKEWREPGMEV